MAAPWFPLAEHPRGATIAAFAARSFLGRAGDERLVVRYLARGDGADARLRVEATFGALAEGPPRHAHGGSMAAVLDEALGVAAWLAVRPAVAARLEVDFRTPVPLGATAIVEPVFVALDARKARLTGRLVGADGTVHAEAAGVFVFLDARHQGRFAGGGA
jgi:acyl-coenzyme A thioesterase PaaI-like protein